jgi:hypothetical protein
MHFSFLFGCSKWEDFRKVYLANSVPNPGHPSRFQSIPSFLFETSGLTARKLLVCKNVCSNVCMTHNFDCPSCVCSRLMHPFLVEATRFLLAGSSSGWFGLGCPAHCTSSFILISSVFISGFGLGALTVIALTFHRWIPAWPASVPRPSYLPPSTSRLVAYLHDD